MTGDGRGFEGGVIIHVSIHARRVTGDKPPLTIIEDTRVSIHARRVTGDKTRSGPPRLAAVSIHARRVTGDRADFLRWVTKELFQFTPVV